MEQPPKTKEEELSGLPGVMKYVRENEARLSSSVQTIKEKAEKNLSMLKDPNRLEEFFKEMLKNVYSSEDAQTLEEIKKINKKYEIRTGPALEPSQEAPIGERLETPAPKEEEKLKKIHNAARMAILNRIVMAEGAKKALDRGDKLGLDGATMYMDGAEEEMNKDVSDLLKGDFGKIPDDISEMVKQYSELRTSIAAEITQRKRELSLRDPLETIKVLDEEILPERTEWGPGESDPTPTEYIHRTPVPEPLRVETGDNREQVLARIRETIAAARVKLAELEKEIELESLREELRNKKKELKKSWFTKDKKEKIAEMETTLDRKENPFKWFLVDKMAPKNYEIIFGTGKKHASVVNRDIFQENPDGKLDGIWETHKISDENDNAVSFSSSGFYLRLKNRKEVETKQGVDVAGPNARYDLVDPSGSVSAADLNYEEGERFLRGTAEQYHKVMLSQFEKLNSQD